ncbi:unnamed protein product [Closterium sp. Naga37s-1]|nr:unnamed protein product [Closterium sp. Naga37s-1]
MAHAPPLLATPVATLSMVAKLWTIVTGAAASSFTGVSLPFFRCHLSVTRRQLPAARRRILAAPRHLLVAGRQLHTARCAPAAIPARPPAGPYAAAAAAHFVTAAAVPPRAASLCSPVAFPSGNAAVGGEVGSPWVGRGLEEGNGGGSEVPGGG